MKLQDFIQDPKYKKKFVLEKLLCHYLNKSRTELRTNSEQEIEKSLIEKIKNDYNDYETNNKPLEYILGYVEFFGIKFFVNENTLVPRPETEYMISAITEHIQKTKKENLILLDIGTGSGVLGCSVLLQNKNNFKEIFLADLSPEALLVAKKNYDNLIDSTKYDTRIIQSDLCSFLENYITIIENREIILVANLPYIPTQTFENDAPDNVQKWEPKMAFIGGDDGLDLYRKMFNQLEYLISKTGSLTMFLEMMTRQVDILKKEFSKKIIFEEVKTFHFNIRIVKAKFIK